MEQAKSQARTVEQIDETLVALIEHANSLGNRISATLDRVRMPQPQEGKVEAQEDVPERSFDRLATRTQSMRVILERMDNYITELEKLI